MTGLLLRRFWRVPVFLGMALGVLLLQAAPSGASPRPGPHPTRPQVRSNTELYWNGALGPGQYSVSGFLPNLPTDFDPLDGYPQGDPVTGFFPQTEYFAGIIHGQPTAPPGSSVVGLYCIDIRTDTFPNTGYGLGTWDEANVTNVGYVARILDEYYPHNPNNPNLPAGLTVDQEAAAAQAAVWFFTDSFVVSESDSTLRAAVAAIVHHIIEEGPVMDQPLPSLNIDPSHANAPAGGVAGPFKIETDQPNATVTAVGGDMFSSPTSTTPLPNPDTLSSGTEIWVRSTGAPRVVLQATAEATVPRGNVYLYDGAEGPSFRQKLIIAETGRLETTVRASADFLPPGSLVVRKRIAGRAAGSQGAVVIRAVCTDGVRRRPFVIRAGAPAGIRSRTYTGIPFGTVCTVTERVNGTTNATEVVVRGDGQEVAIPSGDSVTVRITDRYHFIGSLLVKKTIAGPGAGHQGEIRIHTVCNRRTLTPDFVIPAESGEGEYTKQYDRIRVPARCTVTETADGRTSTVSVDVEGSGQRVSLVPGEIVDAEISDTYGLLPGQLEVNKTIDGVAAGQQGAITIHTVCNGTALPDFVIPAGATGVQPHTYPGLAAGASCTVTETVDGHTSAVSVVVAGSPHTTTIPAGGSAAVTITDTYGARPGSLLVSKTISGPSAGHQGPVTIHVVCDGTALAPDFVIAAGTPASTVSHSFDGISAGSVCTVTEIADGATATVLVTVEGDGQTATIPAGKVASVSLMDVYDEGSPALEGSGTLTVIKHITGPAARHHGRIAILVACGSPINTFAFIIRPHTGPGSVTRSFEIPAGSRCTVTEVAVGRTRRLTVVASGRRQHATIPATGTATVRLADKFTRAIVITRPHPPAVTG